MGLPLPILIGKFPGAFTMDFSIQYATSSEKTKSLSKKINPYLEKQIPIWKKSLSEKKNIPI